jgi:aspartyl/asparaginyl beta-hydroxylase (cupin superfamily)
LLIKILVQAMREIEFPYYSFLHDKYKKNSNKETYYETKDLEWSQEIESKFEIIQNEFSKFLSSNEKQFQNYFSSDLVSETGKWKTIGIVFWGLYHKQNCQQLRESIHLFQQIPGFISVSVSKLEPHSEILGHHGDTDAIYRCHLPLSVPGELPEIGFQVGKEQRSWNTGKLMIFNDAAYHTGWNKTDKERIVLMIDILKPEYLWQRNWICSLVLSSLIVQKFLKLNFRNKRNPLPYIFMVPVVIYSWYYFSLIKPPKFNKNG